MNPSDHTFKDGKLILLQKRSCAETLFHVFNQEFHKDLELEEHASGALSSKIINDEYRNSLLWGTALAVGSEAYHQGSRVDESIYLAIKTCKEIVDSFNNTLSTSGYSGFSNSEFSNTSSTLNYFLHGESLKCYKLADNWAPKALKIAKSKLSDNHIIRNTPCSSCATRVVREMGGDENDAIMVAGFAGGLGLSGHTCGAFVASVWYDALRWLRENPQEKYYPIKLSKDKIQNFLKLTEGQYLCPELSGKTFKTIEEHSDFILEGGCNKLLSILANLPKHGKTS